MLNSIKKVLRISETNQSYNDEINDLILAAKDDLKISGIASSLIDDNDPLIKRAIITYVKAHFGYDNPEADRYSLAYESLKTHLSLVYRDEESKKKVFPDENDSSNQINVSEG